jgi:hypothetical protein
MIMVKCVTGVIVAIVQYQSTLPSSSPVPLLLVSHDCHKLKLTDICSRKCSCGQGLWRCSGLGLAILRKLSKFSI